MIHLVKNIVIKELSDIVEKILKDNLKHFGINMNKKIAEAAVLLLYSFYKEGWHEKVGMYPKELIERIENKIGLKIKYITIRLEGFDGKVYNVVLLRDRNIINALSIARNYLWEVGIIDRPVDIGYKIQKEGEIYIINRY